VDRDPCRSPRLARDRSGWRRGASAAIFVLLVAIVFAGSLGLLGRPKPLRLEWRDAREAEVVSASLREGQGIYVWLQFDGVSEPCAYVLPWDIKMAQRLQTAMQQGQAKDTQVKMTKALFTWNRPTGAQVLLGAATGLAGEVLQPSLSDHL
jgi:hypothetical protein